MLYKGKNVIKDTIIDLAEVVLMNNILQYNKRTVKQKRGTAIGTKLAPPYSAIFMAELEDMIRNLESRSFAWWRYIDDVSFSFGNMFKKS